MSEVRLLSASDVRKIADELDITPTKKLGQNFVIDQNTVKKIITLANILKDETVLEIGPGIGSLTLGIASKEARIIAVEIDDRLANHLSKTISNYAPKAKLTVVNQDALTIKNLPYSPDNLVANLPYNVSVPVLIHMLENFSSIQKALVMVQSEVGHRIAAHPANKIYGAPSVKLSWWGKWKIADNVSRNIFWPVPNVDSVLVSFQANKPLSDDENMRILTFNIIDASFNKRRKMIRQSLQDIFYDSEQTKNILAEAKIDQTLRPEELTVEQFYNIAIASKIK